MHAGSKIGGESKIIFRGNEKRFNNKGIAYETATIVVDNLEEQITNARKERAKKDMLYGALWCVGGGTVFTQ